MIHALMACVFFTGLHATPCLATPSFAILNEAFAFTPVDVPHISADGQTVVGSYYSLDQPPRTRRAWSYVWTGADGLQLLDDLATAAPDQTEFRPYALSGDGTKVVGTLMNEPVIWERGVGTTSLPLLPAGTEGGQAFGISDNGEYVVGSAHNGSYSSSVFVSQTGEITITDHPRYDPVRWNLASGEVTPLSTNGGRALDVANSGTVVGELQYNTPGLSVPATTGFRWDATHGEQLVPTSNPNTSVSTNHTANAISSDGSTIVGSDMAEGRSGPYSFEVRAYSWSGEPGDETTLSLEGLSLLDTPVSQFGYGLAIATAVSADGSTIVGNYYRDEDRLRSTRAFVWTRSNGFQDLSVLLDLLGVSAEDWSLLDVTGISADGKTLVGVGRSTGPGRRLTSHWIAVIPEPSTTLLLGGGLAVLASIRRRPLPRA